MTDLRSIEIDAYDRMHAAKFVGIFNSAHAKKKRRERKLAIREILHPQTRGARYREYMRSPEWSAFRKKILALRGEMCERCGKSGTPLQLHHLSYARLGNELDEDVIIVCVPCHQKRHMDRVSR